MTTPTVGVDVSGGQVQGIVGAGSVVIENLTFYSRAPEEPAQAGAEPIGPCPYPGLAYFGPGDANLFFGRDAAITRLAEAVGRQGFTALVGASGSGKSSVVLAGLAPRLQSDGAGNWRFSHFRIGTELESNPFLALARALAPLYVASDSDVERLRNSKLLAASLAAGELTLRDVFADTRSRNKGRRILLIADQFEEAFTLVADDAVRTRFIDVLLAGFPDPAAGGVPDICLILTMRADFYGRALRHRPLADALQNHVENLGPMNREELQAAIVRPAEKTGVTFEPGMVETLLDTVQSKPGGLPLLQFALREMWGRQERKKITRKSYDEIGGVEGALAQRAETVFAGLTKNGADPAMDKAFQRLFTRLVTLGEGQEDTRRVVERAELGDEVWGLAQRLAGEENRLVVTNASAARETAEVVHEALIRHWPKLVDWINRDRAFQSWLRQIGAGIELWSADPTDDGPLLRGGMLAQATEWLARRRDDLSPKERGYIEASIALRRKVDEEKEAARKAEIASQQELAQAAGKLADEQRRRARIAITWGSIAGAAAILAFGLMIFALSESQRASEEAKRAGIAQQDAEEQAEIARGKTRSAQISRALMVAGLSMKETDEGRAERGLLLVLAVDPERMLRSNLDIIKRADVPVLTAALEHAIYAGVDLQRYDLGAAGTSASLSPDGTRMVTTSRNDNTARLWDVEIGKQVRSLTGHQDEIYRASFSADGRHIVTASRDATARIWEAETGKEVRALTGHRLYVNGASFSPDGRYIVTASSDQTARIWDVETGQEIRALTGHEQGLNNAVFSADGRYIVTASWDKTARLWDAETGKELRALSGHQEQVASASFSPDGRRIVTASGDKTARIWNAETGKEMRVLTGHKGAVSSAAFSADGLSIMTSSWDKTARLWDAFTANEVRALTGHEEAVQTVEFSADGRRIVTVSLDGTARLWDAEIGQQVRVLEHQGAVIDASFSTDRRRVVTASSGNTAQIWDAETGKKLRALTGHQDLVLGAAFSADGLKVVTASYDNTARIWDAETGKELRALAGHQNAVSSASFSPDGRRVVTASRDKTARIWDAETGRDLRTFTGHQDGVSGASFSPDGRRIVTASWDKTARIWDTETGQEVRKLAGHRNSIHSASFSADGRRIVTASDDRTARLWDAETGQEIRALTEPPGTPGGQISAASFSPDGRRIVTTSPYQTVRIWDADSGREVHAFTRHSQSAVHSASFSADGRRIVTGAGDNTSRIWAVMPIADIWKFGRQLQHRELTEAEKQEFYLNE